MKIAYADPPYIGQARKHYSSDPRCAEVDHRQLIVRLCHEFDTWALSCSSPSLKQVLSYCPDDVRIAAWVKPFCSFKPGVNPAYAWEPVIYHGVREMPRHLATVRDWVSANITLRRGLSGVKPERFCYWLFHLLGMTPDDEFHDLYPGSGAVTNAWHLWRRAQLEDWTSIPLFCNMEV